jgi:molybdopterin-guanine dinucleotide biosynthesis protein
MKLFIKTTDKETADKLIAEGFKLISNVNNVYIFLNEESNRLNFESIDKKMIVYDNILSL